MKTYKGLLTDYFKRNKRLNKVSKEVGRANIPEKDFRNGFKILTDEWKAQRENSELFDYQLGRAYGKTN